MPGTVDSFNYGMVIPVMAYLAACLGAALGLRCVARTVHYEQGWKPGWLALGAVSLGCGIWTMHFIAMAGFRVQEAGISYDVGLTVLSLAVAVAVVGMGVFIVGYRGTSPATLGLAGTLTGLGVASMHYLGMSAMRLHGEILFDTFIVTLSVVIAVMAATAALWAVVTIRGFTASLGASLVMAAAVTGMHYTGMASVSVHLHSADQPALDGKPLTSLLFPMLVGPGVFFLIATVTVMFDPILMVGSPDWDQPSTQRLGAPRPRISATTREEDLLVSTMYPEGDAGEA
ncbi:MHYT domain-containing protein [Streptomyces zaomyceticus]|uniref:MHYT domain-containing protein n=1 Tax=Streptomyces zaomyceticus TaxID=68286 RepID=UPI0036CF4164